jgi:hypothetical protein
MRPLRRWTTVVRGDRLDPVELLSEMVATLSAAAHAVVALVERPPTDESQLANVRELAHHDLPRGEDRVSGAGRVDLCRTDQPFARAVTESTWGSWSIAVDSVASSTVAPSGSVTRRSCMRSRAKLASLLCRRHVAVLPSPANVPVPSAMISAMAATSG